MPVAAEALYGYDAMRLVLDSLAAAGPRAGDRTAVVRAALRPRRRGALVADYRDTGGGGSAASRFARYRRAGGRLAFLGLRRAPGGAGPAP
jgi:hypothetical protein